MNLRLNQKVLVIKKILNYLKVYTDITLGNQEIFQNKFVKCHGTLVLNVLNLSAQSMARMTKTVVTALGPFTKISG